MVIGIFIDPGYTPHSSPAPITPKLPVPPPNPNSAALSLADLYRLIPEDGWNWPLLSLLWDRREHSVGLWRLVNKIADDFNPKDRCHKRRVRTSIREDLDKLTRQGWVIRHGGKIQLNMVRIHGQSSL